ncbi:glycine betaine ABC transporter substrate-binding protein [Sporosarcina sp.]|uniref:ABC transporter substrate-binding protein n=1 Tax=Sporosarcina sp. TaxID=49982 RepID=UPI002637FFDD|nr:glycine betaine ABC transporter substrate-binding protein [Sporosarcina sp.]
MRKLLFAISTLALLFVLTACGGKDKETEAGGTYFEMGTQDYTDPKIIAHMVKELVKDQTDHEVNITENIQASPLIITAMDKGDFDLATLYSGEVYNNHFDDDKVEHTTDANKTLAQAQELFNEKFDLKWFDSLGFENKYTIAISDDYAKEKNIETMSDLGELAPELTIGTDSAWIERGDDGYRAFQEHYGYSFKKAVGMEISLMYEGLKTGELDAITAYSVDPEIKELNLKVLEDDEGFFPPSTASLVARNDKLKEYPELEDIINSMIDLINEEEMTQLIYEVDIEKKEPKDVAKNFLVEKGLLK